MSKLTYLTLLVHIFAIVIFLAEITYIFPLKSDTCAKILVAEITGQNWPYVLVCGRKILQTLDMKCPKN